MPAFTFEKISPPVHRGPIAPTAASPTDLSPPEKRPRGVVIQILGRFVEARVQRVERQAPARRDEPSGK